MHVKLLLHGSSFFLAGSALLAGKMALLVEAEQKSA